MSLTLANRITLLRLFCVPFFVLLLLYYEKSVAIGQNNEALRIAASIVFIITFLSDALDGYIARSRNQISHLGTILDPMADKALLLSGLVMLSYSSVEMLYHASAGLVCLACHKPRRNACYRIHSYSCFIRVCYCKTTSSWKNHNLFSNDYYCMGNNGSAGIALFVGSLYRRGVYRDFGIQYFFDGIRQFDKQ